MKRLSTCILLLTMAICASGQTLTGKVTDEQQQPLSYANVVFLSLPDSAFVAGAVSGEDGSFSLSAEGGKGVLKVSCIGYTTLYKDCGPGEQLSLQLKADAQLLDEVVVKGDLPKTRLKGSSMITTVAGSVLEKAGTAENLLDRIPGVSAGGGAVSVFGRGAAEVYINGRKVRDSSELDQLASDNIKGSGAHHHQACAGRGIRLQQPCLCQIQQRLDGAQPVQLQLPLGRLRPVGHAGRFRRACMERKKRCAGYLSRQAVEPAHAHGRKGTFAEPLHHAFGQLYVRQRACTWSTL